MATRSVTLSEAEIKEAIFDYVEKTQGFRPKRASITKIPADRPFDCETMHATASE